MKRTHEIVLKRRAIAVVLREQGYSLNYIAQHLGYSGHSSVRFLLENAVDSPAFQKILIETRMKLGSNAAAN